MTHDDLALLLAAMAWHSKLLAYTLVLLTTITLVGFVWVGLQLRALLTRHDA